VTGRLYQVDLQNETAKMRADVTVLSKIRDEPSLRLVEPVTPPWLRLLIYTCDTNISIVVVMLSVWGTGSWIPGASYSHARQLTAFFGQINNALTSSCLCDLSVLVFLFIFDNILYTFKFHSTSCLYISFIHLDFFLCPTLSMQFLTSPCLGTNTTSADTAAV
jgi:hypothetical protein